LKPAAQASFQRCADEKVPSSGDEKKTAQYESNAGNETKRNRVAEQQASQQWRQRECKRNKRVRT
jgi:hypothetical protein